MSTKTPATPLAPRRLAALAEACLLISDARSYGLIDGGPEVDRERCREVLRELRREGCVAHPDDVEWALLDLLAPSPASSSTEPDSPSASGAGGSPTAKSN